MMRVSFYLLALRQSQNKFNMKKSLFFAALMAFGMTAFAQEKERRGYPEKGDLELGAGLGVNLSNISGDDFDYDTGTGFNVAGSADYYFSNRWSIKAKLMYDQKGCNDVYLLTDTDEYYTNFNLNYLTIPVMANWHFGKNRQWYLNFGPYASFLMSAEETEGGLDLKDGFNSTDFGVEVGIGVKIPLNDQLKLFIEYEDSAGLSDISKGNDGTFRNTRGCFNIGLNFMLK